MGWKENYYLTASRFVPYKRIDLIVDAFSKMPDKKLIVIGDGPDEEKIKQKSSKNIEFLGYQTGAVLIERMQKAKAFVFTAEEDFGIMVVEALSCGTPVIAFNKGGTAETVTDFKNGIHFNSQTIEAITDAVNKFELSQDKFDLEIISKDAKKYDRKIFEEKIQSFIQERTKEFFQ
ncbi:MAG: glycosyltransferase [Ignavibacteriaceae bacterium]